MTMGNIFAPLVVLAFIYRVFAIMFPFLRPGRIIAAIGKLILIGILGLLGIVLLADLALGVLLRNWGLG